MSNLETKTPDTTSYRICRTINKEHLNGVITIIDFGDNTGLAVVYVREVRNNNLDWHVSSEKIKYLPNTKQWQTSVPHECYNGYMQDWYFAEILKRDDGPPRVINDGGDNNEHYEAYIKYELVGEGTPPWTSSYNYQKQGDGTGTGGNTDTGQ